MDVLSPEAVVRALNWRYSVKRFDASKRIPAVAWSALEQALVLAPSSYGLQPWTFVVVEDSAVRERLVAASWNQRQVADASHFVAFAIRKGLSAPDVDRWLARIVEVRGVPPESLAGYRKGILAFLARPGPPERVDDWSARQVYLALGQFMTSAAAMGIDTCPMEGLEPAKYDEILGLSAKGLSVVVACAAGYRAAEDKYAAAKKVRYPAESVLLRI
jgi:nitroreductase